MNICIFEDFFISNLFPVNYLRHTSEIICGAVSLKDKAEKYFKPKSVYIYTRNYLSSYLKKKYSKNKVNVFPERECLFLNSRVIFNKELAGKILNKKNVLWTKDGHIVAIHAGGLAFDLINKIFSLKPAELNDFGGIELETVEIKGDIKIINNLSDLIRYHEDELNNDFNNIFKYKKLIISAKCKISKQTVFDTSSGTIFIGKNTIIEPFSFIKGPVFIGNNCIVRSGSQIYGPLSTGNYCKISDEISSSILHSYVNKQHPGFLGHSYLCEWVNLGAGTNTSNLKNNYSKIKLKIGSKTIETDSIFLGSIIGDHTKTGINTMLNTGTVIGISCNIFGSGYHNKYIKSFSWDDASTGKNIPYEYDKAVQTAFVSMKRRNIEMSREYEDLLKYVYVNKDKLPV